MLRFVIRKMLSKKWMVLSLLIGNILLVGITAGNPMYTQAVLQRTLTRSLEAYLEETNVYPGLMTMRSGSNTRSLPKLMDYDAKIQVLPERFGIDAVETVRYVGTGDTRVNLDMQRGKGGTVTMCIATLSDLENHIELVGGDMFSAGPGEDGVIDAIVSERAMIDKDLLLGDLMTLPNVEDPEGNPLRVRVAGVFRNSDSGDRYWVRTPSAYKNCLFFHPQLFEEYFMSSDELTEYLDMTWYTLLDYTAMRGDQAQHLLQTAQTVAEEFGEGKFVDYRDSFSGVLTEYLKTAKKVNITLWVLQAPIFMLLAAFIFMVSSQMLDMEKNEIAVIKSRGASRGQIFGMYLLQSAIISAVAYAVGVPLGAYLCQVVGSANAFLEFVRRSALPVEVNAQALLFAGAASLLSMGAMVLPATRHSRTSIVNHKQKKHRSSDMPLWQKLGLDFILLAVALYGLYSFEGQRDVLAARVQEGASLDPLLFLSSSLFMVGAGLLAVRIVPMIVWLIYRPFKNLWSPALYASFLRVLRTRSSQGFIMVFLIMTIALGVFNAQAARTINQNAEDNLRYSTGADIVVQEAWKSNADLVAQDPSVPLVYREPDFGRYESLDGAQSVAKVYYNKNITASIGKGTVKNVRLMGIHTKDFGETAWFKDSLSDIHWYHYLNAMSKNSSAVLVSRNLQTEHGCRLGDAISYRSANGDSIRGVIYGFVDYFPGFEPVTYEKGADGLYAEKQNYLIVAHLSQIQSAWGVLPYQVWLKNVDDSGYLYEFAEEGDTVFRVFEDADALLVEKKNDPVLQGTNGILTGGFIVVLLLCSVGFLIYWILSIQSRSLQFGIFRAMGMSMREVITMLLNEQLYISGLSIAVGALVGHLTAKLYMPLIQIAYAASDNALPLEVISRASDNVRLFAVIGIVMLVCMVILGGLISRMKIAQALKLGED